MQLATPTYDGNENDEQEPSKAHLTLSPVSIIDHPSKVE